MLFRSVKRTGRYGSFWGCSRYPGCHGTQPFKIDHAGQPCRHCRTPAVRQTHTKPPKLRPGRSYFAWWFKCPRCKAIYLVEAARRFCDATGTTLSSTALFSPDDRVPFCTKPPGTVRLAAERETSQARESNYDVEEIYRAALGHKRDGRAGRPWIITAALSRQTLRRSPSSSVRAVCVNAHLRICAGGGQRWSSLPRQLTVEGGLTVYCRDIPMAPVFGRCPKPIC